MLQILAKNLDLWKGVVDDSVKDDRPELKPEMTTL